MWPVLVVSDLYSTRKVGDGSPYVQYALLEVHVRPPQAAQLAAPAPGRGRDEQQGCQFGILLLRPLDEELDLLRRRRIRFVPFHRSAATPVRPGSAPGGPIGPLVQGGRTHSVVTPDAGRRQTPPAQPVVEGVEVRPLQFPQVLRPQFLGDGGGHTAVLDQRLGGSSTGLDVVEPAIEKAPEGLVGQRDPSQRRLIHQSRRLSLGIASSTMDGGVRVAVAMSVGVPTKGHPDLPNARRSLT